MATYEVSISNFFDAEDAEDAVRQMAEWVKEAAYKAAYRVTSDDTGETSFIDAEDIDFNSIYLDRD